MTFAKSHVEKSKSSKSKAAAAKKKEETAKNSKNTNLKYRDDDDGDDEDDYETDYDEDIEDTESDDDDSTENDYETVSETEEESESESEEVPSKNNKKHRKSNTDNNAKKSKHEKPEDETVTRSKLQEIVSDLFPSKYAKDRAEKTKKSEKKIKEIAAADKKPHKKTKDSKKSKSSKKSESESETGDSDDSDSDYESSETDDDDDDKHAHGVYNILFSVPPEEDDYIDDHDDECDSDDEKDFMKETYQHYEIPEIPNHAGEAKIAPAVASKPKQTKKSKKTAPEIELKNIESEYAELVDTKKQFIEQLKEKPKNKVIRNAIKECDSSIKNLIRKSRKRNAKTYHKLIHSGKTGVNEIEYFKKHLSNTEQLRIMSELKEINKQINIEKPYRLTLLDSKIPAKFKAVALQKLNILRNMEPGDGEYFKIKNWVDLFIRIPFGIYKNLSVKIEDGVDVCHEFMENSMKTLDSCVHGLNSTKIQIMQLLGQWITNPSSVGSSIAICGPPGVGKTTIVKEGISKILGREFAFISLGGTGDSSFLEGHSYTYEGSMCGRIVQILMECKCMNPVIYFDELDKISDTPKGEEIAGILTHLTDTSQNSEFHDKYFSEIEFDMSKCLFIFSYNDESKVNPILRDRMYRIQTKGYESKDKVVIARDYLIPKIREQVKFSNDDVIISDEIIMYLIQNKRFTNGEDGVRNLKRCIEVIFTKLNLFRLIKPDTNIFGKDMNIKVSFPFTVTKQDVDIFIKNEENQNHSMLAMYV
jgi:ATP-dependent Lon protease